MSRLQTPASTTFNNCAEHTLLYAQYHTRPPVGLITKHSITYTSYNTMLTFLLDYNYALTIHTQHTHNLSANTTQRNTPQHT